MWNKIHNCVSEKIAFEKRRTLKSRHTPPYISQMIKFDYKVKLTLEKTMLSYIHAILLEKIDGIQ